MEIKHQDCLYVVDHIYIDQAATNLYHLLLHCEWCGKPIKLTVKTENNVVNWLGGNKGKWIYNELLNNWKCSECGEPPKTIGYVGNADFMKEHFKFCNHCGADMRKGGAE